MLHFTSLTNTTHYDETEHQIDRIINELKQCTQADSFTNLSVNANSNSQLNSDILPPVSTQSYRYNTSNNANRLSSYDNHDIHDYLNMANANLNALNTISEANANNKHVHNSNNGNSQFPNSNALLPPSMLNAGVYSKKRSSIAGSNNSGHAIGSQNQSTKNKTSNSTTAINLTDSPKAVAGSGGGGSLLARAFNYAKSKNSNNATGKETWKSKLGKYLPHQLSNSSHINGQKCKLNRFCYIWFSRIQLKEKFEAKLFKTELSLFRCRLKVVFMSEILVLNPGCLNPKVKKKFGIYFSESVFCKMNRHSNKQKIKFDLFVFFLDLFLARRKF